MRQLVPATPARRFAAWLLDAVIAGVVLLPLNPGLYGKGDDPAAFLALLGAALILLFAAQIAFDGGPRGATPGKRLVGLRVADADGGGAIGYRRAALRRLAYIAGGIPLYIGWLVLLVDSRRQAFHDKVAGTLVVRA